MAKFELTVNGATCAVQAPADKPLLWVLRDGLGLKGAKYGCGVGICGTCTVLVDGAPLRSCVVPAATLTGREILTVEGLAPDDAVVAAWIAGQVPQCGYCQPGQVMTATALFRTTRRPQAAQAACAMRGVLCRCGTYPRIARAIEQLATGAVNSPAPQPTPWAARPAPHVFDHWIGLDDDGSIVLQVDRTEMGQGTLTALAMLVAEEMDAPLAQVRVQFAPAARAYSNPRLGEQMTGGSTSVRAAWGPLRQSAALARARLVAAAARAWHVPARDCTVSSGVVYHHGSGRSAGFGQLARRAAAARPPRNVAPRPAADWRLLGRDTPRIEVPGHARGESVFTTDLERPGMWWATVLPPPRLGARVRSIEAERARAVPGVRAVLRVPGGVAVVADDFWSALKARDRLRVRWSGESPATADDRGLRAFLFQAAVGRRARVVRRQGDALGEIRRADRVLEAVYETPLLAHATLEPMDCLAEVRRGACEIWTGTQAQSGARRAAARAAGVAPRNVRVHTMFAGGGFGRRLEQDFVTDAVTIARRVRRPVMLLYTRADDMRRDFFRPASVVLLRAGLDRDGQPRAWRQRIAGPADAREANNLDYEIPCVRVEHVDADPGLPAGAWRSVGAAQNAFAIEGFVDELAHAAGADPLDYRLCLLDRAPRLAAALRLAAQQAGWGRCEDGRHQGLAAFRGFGSYVAMVAEVSLRHGALRVERIVAAIDCGRVLNPDAVRAQVEGGVAFGLSAALRERIHLRAGAVEQENLQDYPVLRFDEMPVVEVHLVESAEDPGGVGEPGVPAVAPAVVNAIFAATGVRLRRLPVVEGLPAGIRLAQGVAADSDGL